MSEPRIALVAEGQTDLVVIEAALKAIVPSRFTLNLLQPEATKPEMGTGWGGCVEVVRGHSTTSCSLAGHRPDVGRHRSAGGSPRCRCVSGEIRGLRASGPRAGDRQRMGSTALSPALSARGTNLHPAGGGALQLAEPCQRWRQNSAVSARSVVRHMAGCSHIACRPPVARRR